MTLCTEKWRQVSISPGPAFLLSCRYISLVKGTLNVAVSDSARWLVRGKKNSADFNLFLFPYAGGDVRSLMKWQALLNNRIELIGIQLPGRGGNGAEKEVKHIQSIVNTILPLILDSDKPFAFFGHSLGALLAFLVCRQLNHFTQKAPVALIISGCKSPNNFIVREKKELTDALLLEMLRKYGGTPEEIFKDREMMELLLPVLRADLSLVESFTYVEKDPLKVPLLILSGEDDEAHHLTKCIDWQRETDIEVCHKTFSGGHFFIQQQQDKVLNEVNRFLMAAFLRKS